MKILINLFFAISFSALLFAQQPGTIQRSQLIETLDGKEFYIHLVRQGENLQNLATAYNVSVTEIREHNPRLVGAADVGDVLKIPKRERPEPSEVIREQAPVRTPVEEPRRIPPVDPTPKGIQHTVSPQETFFGIARRYEISVAELRAANPDVEVLQPGQVLNIPVEIPASPSPADRIEHDVPARPVEEPKRTERDQQPATYTVQAGETLFSISRRFGIDIDKLVSLNPELSEGLKAGQVIRLSGEIRKVEEQYKIVQDTTVTYTYHRVRRGETLFGISRQYGVSIEIIEEYNPHILDGLQPRQVLQIPVYEISERKVIREIVPVEPVEVPVDTIIERDYADCIRIADLQRKYSIALMIPFFLDATEEVMQEDSTMAVVPVNPVRNFDFMQFYYGAMLAIDSLSQLGLNANVHVFDVDHTPESVMKVLNEPYLDGMDLIIGPLYANSYERVARFARDNRIPIVNPLSPRNEFLVHNAYTIKAQPSATAQVELIANYIHDNFFGHNVIVVRQFSFSETATLELIKNRLNEHRVHEVIYIRDSLPGIVRYLDPEGDNIVIGLSTDKVFSMDLIRKLNDIRSDYRITCFGMQEWEDFNLDTDHMVNLRLHLPATSFIDFESDHVRDFIKAFRAKFDTEPMPNRFAFAAFDITWYFINAITGYGADFSKCLPAYNYRGLQIPFNFEPQDRHGFENKGLTLYRIDNFRKVQVYPYQY